LTLDTGRLRLRLRPLFRGRVEFAELVLAKPTITVVRDPGGRLNIATLGASSEPRATARAPRTGSGTSVGAAGALPASGRLGRGGGRLPAELRRGGEGRAGDRGNGRRADGVGGHQAQQARRRADEPAMPRAEAADVFDSLREPQHDVA